jgi:hypothetical protein
VIHISPAKNADSTSTKRLPPRRPYSSDVVHLMLFLFLPQKPKRKKKERSSSVIIRLLQPRMSLSLLYFHQFHLYNVTLKTFHNQPTPIDNNINALESRCMDGKAINETWLPWTPAKQSLSKVGLEK